MHSPAQVYPVEGANLSMVGWDMLVGVSFSMQVSSTDGHFAAHPNLQMVLICLARDV